MGYVATAVTRQVDVSANPRLTGALNALLRPTIGVPMRMVLASSGAAGALVEPAPAFAALKSGTQALVAYVDAYGHVPPELAAVGKAALAREILPDQLARRVRDAVSLLLPPESLPGDTQAPRRFATQIASPAAASPRPARSARSRPIRPRSPST